MILYGSARGERTNTHVGMIVKDTPNERFGIEWFRGLGPERTQMMTRIGCVVLMRTVIRFIVPKKHAYYSLCVETGSWGDDLGGAMQNEKIISFSHSSRIMCIRM
jgi:hypothetical protein